MCKHIYREAGSIRVCLKCGLTINRVTGQVMLFDRRLPSLAQKGGGRK